MECRRDRAGRRIFYLNGKRVPKSQVPRDMWDVCVTPQSYLDTLPTELKWEVSRRLPVSRSYFPELASTPQYWQERSRPWGGQATNKYEYDRGREDYWYKLNDAFLRADDAELRLALALEAQVNDISLGANHLNRYPDRYPVEVKRVLLNTPANFPTMKLSEIRSEKEYIEQPSRNEIAVILNDKFLLGTNWEGFDLDDYLGYLEDLLDVLQPSLASRRVMAASVKANVNLRRRGKTQATRILLG